MGVKAKGAARVTLCEWGSLNVIKRQHPSVHGVVQVAEYDSIPSANVWYCLMVDIDKVDVQ